MADRWEAMEELDQLLAGGGTAVRLLSRTEHIGLFEVSATAGAGRRGRVLQVVRVGGAGPGEEAWWRYGSPVWGPFSRGGRGGVFKRSGFLRRRRAANPPAWKGLRTCSGCQHVFTELSTGDRRIMVVRPRVPEAGGLRPVPDLPGGTDPGVGPHGAFTLSRRCPRCRDVDHGGLHLAGMEADLALGRTLALQRHAGATVDQVNGAVRVIADVGGPSPLVRLLTRHGRPLGDLPLAGALALEMYAAEAREGALLKMEVGQLETRWRREEELAALVDGDLTPIPLLDELRRKVTRKK